MITKITAANAEQYRALFTKATADLRVYDSQGRKQGDTGFAGAVITASPTYAAVTITPEQYVAGEVWVKEGNTYRQTELSEHYVSGTQYYIQMINGEITSLDEYFFYIKDLMNINPVYTILPLDEQIFTIDANTRTITIPDAFKKNGVSVQSDVVSEVLYFSIDRFYDMEDLHNDEIFIEWRTPADKDGNVYEGVSKPWAIDLESHPGLVVFGWPLSKEITAIPGDVTFSVRFYRYDEESKTLQYSLSTLPHTVTIKAGIDLQKDTRANLEDPYAIADAEQLLKDRLINSEDVSSASPTPAYPVIITADTASPKDVYITDEDGDLGGRTAKLYTYIPKTDLENNMTIGNRYDEYVVYLTDKDFDNEPHNSANGAVVNSGTHTKKEQNAEAAVRAIANDAGELTFAWIKLDSEGNVANTSWFQNDSHNNLSANAAAAKMFRKTNDSGFTTGRVYYYKKNNDFIKYTGQQSGSPRTLQPEGATEAGLFERWTWTRLNCAIEENGQGAADDNWVIGSYQARVTNRVGRKTNRTYGPVIRVPEPTQPVVTNDLIPKTGNVYTWDNGVAAEVRGGAIFGGLTGEDNKIQLTVTADVDTHGYTTFEWYRGDELVGTTLVQNRVAKVADKIDTVTSSMTFTGIPYTSSSYTTANKGNDGIYKCTVKTLLNSVISTADDATLVRITHAPAHGSLVYGAELINQEYIVGKNQKMEVYLAPNDKEERTATDQFTAQWYKYTASGTGAASQAQTNTDKALAEAGNYVPKATDIPVSDEMNVTNKTKVYDAADHVGLDLSFTVPDNPNQRDDGYYFCVVRNKYNGAVGTQSTQFITLIDN